MLFAAGNVNGTSAALFRLAKGPGVRLGGFFQSLGDSLVTGPTRTNVNDFRAILIQAKA